MSSTKKLSQQAYVIYFIGNTAGVFVTSEEGSQKDLEGKSKSCEKKSKV